MTQEDLQKREQKDRRKFALIVGGLLAGVLLGFGVLTWAFLMDTFTAEEPPAPPAFVDPENPFDWDDPETGSDEDMADNGAGDVL